MHKFLCYSRGRLLFWVMGTSLFIFMMNIGASIAVDHIINAIGATKLNDGWVWLFLGWPPYATIITIIFATTITCTLCGIFFNHFGSVGEKLQADLVKIILIAGLMACYLQFLIVPALHTLFSNDPEAFKMVMVRINDTLGVKQNNENIIYPSLPNSIVGWAKMSLGLVIFGLSWGVICIPLAKIYSKIILNKAGSPKIRTYLWFLSCLVVMILHRYIAQSASLTKFL